MSKKNIIDIYSQDGGQAANSSQILANSLLDFTNHSVNMITNNDYTKELSLRSSKDENGWLWKGNLSQLKSFVSNELNLNGQWSSPGGETKVFRNSQITLKWTGQTRGKFIVETDNKLVQVAKTLQTLYSKYSNTRLDTKQNNAIDCYGSTTEAGRSAAAGPKLSTTSGEIYETQDVLCSRLNEIILSYNNKILRMKAEINQVRSECENKMEILSRNSCGTSLEHKYEKLFEAK